MAKCNPPGILIPNEEPASCMVNLSDYFKNSCGDFSFVLFSDPDVSHRIPVTGGKIRFSHGDKTVAALFDANHEENGFVVLARNPIPKSPDLRKEYHNRASSSFNPFLVGLIPGIPYNSTESLPIPTSSKELTVAISSESVKTVFRSAGLRIRNSELRQTNRGEKTVSSRYAGLSVSLNQNGFYSLLSNSVFSEPYIVTLCETVRMAVVPVVPIPFDPIKILPVENKPAGKIKNTTDSMKINLEPGEGIIALLKPVQCTQNGMVQIEYQTSCNDHIQLSLIAFNAAESNWNSIDSGQMAYLTKRNKSLTIQTTDKLLVDYMPPDRFLIPAVQAVNDSSHSVEIVLQNGVVFKSPPLVDYALNPNVTASTNSNPHFPYGCAATVLKNLAPLSGNTKGDVKWCEMNNFRTPFGPGCMLLKASGMDAAGAANIVVEASAESGLLTSEVSLKRISGAMGTVTLMNYVEGGDMESCVKINSKTLSPDQWNTIRSTIIVPDLNHKVFVMVQNSGGDAAMAVDDVIPRQVEDESIYFDQEIFRHFLRKDRKEINLQE